jgi:hypothetical protein
MWVFLTEKGRRKGRVNKNVGVQNLEPDKQRERIGRGQ